MQNPTTVAEVVADILKNMSDTAKAELIHTPEEDLIQFHNTWRRDICNRYNLWRNTELVKATGGDHPDDASGVIIKAIWKALQVPRPS